MFWLISLVLPAVMILYEHREARQIAENDVEKQVRNTARNLLENIQENYQAEIQIRELLADFFEEAVHLTASTGSGASVAEIEAWKTAIKTCYLKKLERWLPPHDLIWLPHPRLGAIASHPFVIDGRLGLANGPGMAFARSIFGDPAASSATSVRQELAPLLKFPLTFPQTNYIQGFLQVFRSEAGKRGWFCIARHEGALAVLLDLKELDPLLGLRILAAGSTSREWEMAFFPNDGGEPIVTAGLQQKPALRATLSTSMSGPKPLDGESWLKTRWAYAGELREGFPWRAVVLCPPLKGSEIFYSGSLPWLAGALCLFTCGIWGAWKFLLGGGLRLSVGLVMLWACLWLVLLPLIGIRAVAKKAAVEFGQTLVQDRAREIHDEMVRFDAGVRFLEAGQIHRLIEIAAQPEFSAKLRAGVPQAEVRAALVNLISKAHPPKPFLAICSLDFMVAADRNGFKASFCFQKGKNESLWEGSEELAGSFAPFIRKILDRVAGKRDRPVRGKNVKTNGPSWKEKLHEEAFATIVGNLFGPRAVLRLLNCPGIVTECQTTHFRASFLPAFLHHSGNRPEGLILWAWADWVGGNFIAWRLASSASGVSLPELSDHYRARDSENPARMPSGDGWLVGTLGEYTAEQKVSNRFRPPQIMERTFHKLRRSSMSRAFRDTSTPGRPLIEIMPGRNLSRSILARLRTTEDIDRREAGLTNGVSVATIFAFLIALVLSWLARGRFLEPLGLIQAGVRAIDAGDFKVRLELPEGDEFGSVGHAFNKMAHSLDQGKILGKYVSESVRRAIRDRDFLETARRGSRRDVTVLFSGLLNVDALLEKSGQDAVFQALGRHLNAFSEAVEREGGEIDKVIGEKILVVFDHETCGGAIPAAATALRVIRKVRSELQLAGLTAAMGLDSGPVIAGILGSPLVKEDYTVIGDTVNLAARLAALAPSAGESRVILSGAVTGLVEHHARVRQLPVRSVKGKNREVEAYLLLDDPEEKRGAGK